LWGLGKNSQITPNLVARVVRAWVRGDIVILAGQPGTGKTDFSRILSDCLRDVFGDLTLNWISIRPDFDEADMIGYERLDGSPRLRQFSEDVLQPDALGGHHLVVLEECNLATIETYLAPILVAMQEQDRRVRLPDGEEARLPADTFFLATCNSYLDDPDTRLRISFPTKRRASVITMPNVLYDRWVSGGKGEEIVVGLAVTAIRRERGRIEQRRALGLVSSLDAARLAKLDEVESGDDLSAAARVALATIVGVVFAMDEGRDYFTMGLLRDIALDIAYADRTAEAELEALSNAVTDKLLHQLRGRASYANDILEVVGMLPGVDEIERLLRRMSAGAGGELRQLL